MRRLPLLAALLLAAAAHAHPIPRSEFDRNVTVTWRSDFVQVLYRVEVDEFTLLATVSQPDGGFKLPPGKLGRKDVGDAYIARMREVIPDGLVATVDGQPVPFTVAEAKVDFTDSAQFRFRLRANKVLTPGKHALEIEDTNFVGMKGRLAMKFESDLPTESVAEPPESVRIDADARERRTLSAVTVIPEVLPPEKPLVVEEPEPPPSPPPTFWELLRQAGEGQSLAGLLDSDVGLWMVMLLALGHGIIHSVSPGHGKTMVAAYLVGEQGTPRHAVILGLIVTLTHTSAAFAVALLLKFVLPPTAAPTVQRVLGIGGGVLVLGIGLWLLMQRLAGRSDHVHVGGSHSHSHADGHAHSHGLTPEQFGRVGWVRLILLGISGGIVPCWGAILWVLYCVTAGRYGLALWAVLSFSLGLAAILIAIGLGVVWGGRAGSRRFAGRRWFRHVVHWLPIVGAALVALIGFWLVRSNIG